MIGLIALATAGLCLIMALGWTFQRARNNGGWTDVFWTFGVGVTGVACALWPLHGGAPSLRQWLTAALVGAWSARLGGHIALRVARSPEDARYADLRAAWGRDFQGRMARFLAGQGVFSLPLLTSVAIAAHNRAPHLQLSDVGGALVLVIAVAGEALSDRQLAAFKSDPASAGRVCDVGLWAWSRHPNYFFEWFGWLAYPLIALGAPWPQAALALAAPLAMYLILRFGTGAPPLEAHMLRSRGAAFRAYQRRTSPFFLLPPKRRGA